MECEAIDPLERASEARLKAVLIATLSDCEDYWLWMAARANFRRIRWLEQEREVSALLAKYRMVR